MPGLCFHWTKGGLCLARMNAVRKSYLFEGCSVPRAYRTYLCDKRNQFCAKISLFIE